MCPRHVSGRYPTPGYEERTFSALPSDFSPEVCLDVASTISSTRMSASFSLILLGEVFFDLGNEKATDLPCVLAKGFEALVRKNADSPVGSLRGTKVFHKERMRKPVTEVVDCS